MFQISFVYSSRVEHRPGVRICLCLPWSMRAEMKTGSAAPNDSLSGSSNFNHPNYTTWECRCPGELWQPWKDFPAQAQQWYRLDNGTLWHSYRPKKGGQFCKQLLCNHWLAISLAPAQLQIGRKPKKSRCLNFSHPQKGAKKWYCSYCGSLYLFYLVE